MKAADNAPPGMSAVNITGTARLGGNALVRQARYATMSWAVQPTGVTNHRSRLTDQVYVSVAGSEQAPFSLTVDPSLHLETSLAGSVKFPVKIVRRGGFKGAVELFVYGLPPTLHGPLHAQPKYHTPITLPADKDTTEFTITVPNHVPPGNYTFFLSGVGTVSYQRNPEQLREAEKRLAAIEKIVAENEVRLKAALAAQAAAGKVLADAQAAKQDTKKANEAKLAADRSVAEADQKAKQDTTFLQSFRQEVSKLQQRAKPTDVKISAPSNGIPLTIRPAPVELHLADAPLSVKQGTRIEVPLTIKRLYGFADPVGVQFLGAFNITGITAPPVTIPAGKSEGQFVIEAAANAPPGTYTSTVQATLTYHGQPLTVKQDLTLTIAPTRK
jgi:hypothetical protein